MIGIIDYGSGNIGAIKNIYHSLGIQYSIINNPDSLNEEITKIILPGVGAFDKTMSVLKSSGFINNLNYFSKIKGIPTLGICVGMQVFANYSEEGDSEGLGWINGVVKKIDISNITFKPKLPHMGWNSINMLSDSLLLKSIDTSKGFYFLHSYHFECFDKSNILATTEYIDTFNSVVFSNNIFGTQFHPEKSHKNGVQILLNFANL